MMLSCPQVDLESDRSRLCWNSVYSVLMFEGVKHEEMALIKLQETKLRELVEEFSSEGKKAYTLIANALPGGFSVIAIKKNMSRLGLRVSTKENDTPAGSDESEDDYDRDNIPSIADALGHLDDPSMPRKKVSKKQRKRSKALFDAISSKQRHAMGAGSGHELEDGEDDADDLMDLDEGVARQDALLSSDDDAPRGQTSKDQKIKSKKQFKPRAEKNPVKAPKANVRRESKPKQTLPEALAAVVEELKISGEGVHAYSARMHFAEFDRCMSEMSCCRCTCMCSHATSAINFRHAGFGLG